jgi:hypothetical protein
MQGIVQHIHPLPPKENSHVTPHPPKQEGGLTLKAEANLPSVAIGQERIPDLRLQSRLTGIQGATVSLVIKQTRSGHHVLQHIIVVMNKGPKAGVNHQAEITKQRPENHLHHQNVDVHTLTTKRELSHPHPLSGEETANRNGGVKAEVAAAAAAAAAVQILV